MIEELEKFQEKIGDKLNKYLLFSYKLTCYYVNINKYGIYIEFNLKSKRYYFELPEITSFNLSDIGFELYINKCLHKIKNEILKDLINYKFL